jgi:hypothetical protein
MPGRMNRPRISLALQTPAQDPQGEIGSTDELAGSGGPASPCWQNEARNLNDFNVRFLSTGRACLIGETDPYDENARK